MKAKRKKLFAANNASIKLMEADGWTCGVTEQTIRTGRIVFKRDLYGFIDFIAISPTRGTMAVQSTGGGNAQSRIAKIKAEPRAAIWLACGNRIQVHDWRKRAGKTQRECVVFEITKGEQEKTVIEVREMQ